MPEEQHSTPPLLASRLTPPPPPAPLLVRPRLLARLDEGSTGTVTLVSAPAGFGKTTLLASWARAAPEPAGPGWLSVETGDTGDRFWAYLTRVLHAATGTATAPGPEPAGGAFLPDPAGAVPGPVPAGGAPLPDLAGASSGPVPAGGAGPPGTAQLEALAATLAAAEAPVLLILDDLHRITEPGALAGLEFLVRYADGRLRLVIGARGDLPAALHRLRLAGELTEIGPDQLAFTDDEVADLLVAHGAHLPASAVPRLRDRTGGWPAALRFAALAARGQPDPARWVRRFGGDHPDVAGYLRAELLDGLDPADRDTLRRCAVTAAVRADLAGALTDRPDADRVLAVLARDGGFLRHDDSSPPWYRCHPLLADLLRAELAGLGDDAVRDLHRRAAGWYAGHGRPADALRHALAAGEWDRAAALLATDWPELIPYDRDLPATPPPAAPPPEARHGYPDLVLALAVERAAAADATAASGHLRAATELARSLPPPHRARYLRLATVLELTLARRAGDHRATRALADRLLDATPPGDDPTRPGSEPDLSAPASATTTVDVDGRAVAGTARGLVDLADGDLTGALEHLLPALAAARAGGRGRTELVCASRVALLRAVGGDLVAAEHAAREVLAMPACQGWACLEDCAHGYLALAVVALHRDLPDEVEANLALAGPAAHEPAVGAIVALCRVPLLRDAGEFTAAYRVLTEARQRVAALPAARELTDRLLAAEADLLVARGDLAGARHLLSDPPPATSSSGPAPPGRVVPAGAAVPTGSAGGAAEPAVALARMEVLAGDQRAAARALPAWDGPDAERLPLPVRLDAGLLDAVLARAGGDERRAGRLLERLLDLAAPQGYRRVFTQAVPGVRDLLAGHLDSGTAHWATVTDLLQAVDAPAGRAPAEPVPGLAEPLTERELTILRYLQSILSNVEIAGELSVSVNTVKTHVRNIYRKLDATRRREAVRRARDLHLI
ncbi:hypothetical protein AWW66_07985 [Micromonospora rosaria]|uniref:HTH luxR-type domain-containing protein n=1 Tax=Micromonospora rosaria TaxID=47874 RepID=A0A136PVI9_9ACTN|nr:LuxR C-terminal-related transcriptional regulator [Micromonospora rosaria]KXK62488.1 hypothetical protein AWW66_07985 [Micromonospora rosaria]